METEKVPPSPAEGETKEKVKTAKDIQREMEQWAKKSNKNTKAKPISISFKTTTTASIQGASTSSDGDEKSRTADMAFNMLEKVR
jgi:hypothetical protein